MKNVTVVPANFEKPMLNQLASRPYWCISRQRSWGGYINSYCFLLFVFLFTLYSRVYMHSFSLLVPIPVFYQSQSPTKEAILHRFVRNLFQKNLSVLSYLLTFLRSRFSCI